MVVVKDGFPYAVNVDWLQVYVTDNNPDDLAVIYNPRGLYEFVLQPCSSRHFREIWKVLNSDGDDYAVIQRRPFSSILDKSGAIIQLCNRELYKPFMSDNFLHFLRNHGFSYKSLSRLDVCFDSTVLADGLLHADLIKGIMAEKYLKNNQAKVKWHFDSMANIGRPMECNSASFGSKSSPVSSKIYNKTLELSEVKNKPYIVENWQVNDIDVSQDVWRIEISIKSDAATGVRKSTGELFKLCPSMLNFQKDVEDVFFSYAAKYFSFKVNTGGKNKTRMPDLRLFPNQRRTTIRPMRITNERDSTRSDKIFLKKLHGLFKELTNLDYKTEAAIWEVSSAFAMNKSLANWRKAKLLDGEYDDFPRRSKVDLYNRIDSLSRDLCELYPIDKQAITACIDKLLTIIDIKL